MKRALLCVAAIAGISADVPAQPATLTPVASVSAPVDMIRIDSGRAYLMAGTTLTIIDVSNPAAPRRLGSFEVPDRVWGFTAKGSRVYVAADLWGVGIIDVSNPADPTLVAHYKTKGQAHSVDVFGKTMLVCDHMLGVAYFDISNERSPVLVNSTFVEGYPRFLSVVGSSVYAVDSPLGFYVLDAAKPSDETVGAVQTPASGYGRIISIGVADLSAGGGPKFAVVSGGSALHAFNVSTPSAPVLISKLATPGKGPRMAMAGTLAYVADNAEGIQVVDFSAPSAPKIVANHKTTKPAIDVAVVDSLVYVAAGRGRNQVSNRFEGDELLILRRQ
jgi:hypothetical protein